MWPSVHLQDVEFGYGRQPAVLRIDELVLRQGERVFLHGPSGCGKSTLLGLIAGVTVARRGRVEVLGHRLESMSPPARDRLRGSSIGYIFQLFNLVPYLSAYDNIALPLKLHPDRRRGLGGKDEKTAIAALSADLAIESLLPRRASELSVGQQQRVAAARALIGSPPLLIADEPTSSLDSAHRDSFLEMLFRHAEPTQTTVLFVSHDLTLASRFERTIAFESIHRGGPG